MIELLMEYRAYIPVILLLIFGTKLTASSEPEVRLAGLFFAMVGAISLPVTSMAFTLGGAITIGFVFLTM